MVDLDVRTYEMLTQGHFIRANYPWKLHWAVLSLVVRNYL